MSETFLVTLVQTERHLTVSMRGTADASVIDEVQARFATIHATALASSVTEVVIDLVDLEFASSACLKEFVSWLRQVDELPDVSQKYRVVFRSNPKHRWQKTSLAVLVTFGAGFTTIETAT